MSCFGLTDTCAFHRCRGWQRHLLGVVISWLPLLAIQTIEFEGVREGEGVMFEISDGLVTWQYVAGSIRILSEAMVAWFLVAEFAFVISKGSLGEGISIPKLTCLPREHATGFGIALVGSCLLALDPVVWRLMIPAFTG